jgi:hypothetical protein
MQLDQVSMMTEKLYQGDEKILMTIFGLMGKEQLNAAIDKFSVRLAIFKMFSFYPKTFKEAAVYSITITFPTIGNVEQKWGRSSFKLRAIRAADSSNEEIIW